MGRLPKTLSHTEKKQGSFSDLLNTEIEIPFLASIKEKEIIDFTRDLSVMLSAKIPLLNALTIARKQTENKKLAQIIDELIRDVKKGNSLSKGLSRYPNIFDKVYVELIKVGEASGTLDQIFTRLLNYREKAYKLKQRIKMALSYPVIILSVAFLAITFLLIFVVPTFVEMYEDFQAELPLPTMIILQISNFMGQNIIVIIISFILLFFGFRALLKIEKWNIMKDKLLLKLPYFGGLYTKTLISQFSKSLSTLLSSGVNLTESLKVLVNTSSNKVLQMETSSMIASLNKGKSFQHSFENSYVFPLMISQMIGVGEETANLEEMLSQISTQYEEESDLMIEGLTSVIEPILIVIIGIVLGLIIVALYLPIFELVNVVG